MLSEQDIQKLKDIPLVDVMRANGFEPVRLPKGDGRVTYLCPFHPETEGSFLVDQHRYGDSTDAEWKCYGKCGISGYGAIALQARLLGYEDYGHLTDKQMKTVVQRLVDDHGIYLPQQTNSVQRPSVRRNVSLILHPGRQNTFVHWALR